MNSTTQCHCCLLRPAEKDLKKPHTRLGITEIFAVMMEECFSIQLFLDNGDSGICEPCLGRLRDSCQFKLQVQSCQAKLRSAARGWGFKESGFKESSSASRSEKSPTAPEVVVLDDSSDEHRPDDADDAMDHDEVFGELSTHEELEEAPSVSPEDMTREETLLQTPDVATPGKDAVTRSIKLEVLATSPFARRPPARAARDTVPRPAPSPQASQPAPDAQRSSGRSLNLESTSKRRIEPDEGAQRSAKLFRMSRPTVIGNRRVSFRPPASDLESASKGDTDPDRGTKRPVTSHDGSRATGIDGRRRPSFNPLTTDFESASKNKSDLDSGTRLPLTSHDVSKRRSYGPLTSHLGSSSSRIRFEDGAQQPKTSPHVLKPSGRTIGSRKCERALKSEPSSHTNLLDNVAQRSVTSHVSKPSDRADVPRDTNKNTYMCEICGDIFTDEVTLNTHTLTHNIRDEVTVFSCKTCLEEFSSEESLVEHFNVHMDYKSYVCDMCAMAFGIKSNLISHMQTHESGDGYLCVDYKKTFENGSFAADSNEKKHYACKECDKEFKLQIQLNIHKKIHDPKPLTSSDVTSNKYSLIKDIKVETRDNLHRSVRSKTTFKPDISDVDYNGKQIHKKKRPYACQYCKKRFVYKGRLLSHENGHKKYRCEKCDRPFKTEKNLLNHNLRFHSKDELTNSNNWDAKNVEKNIEKMRTHVYKLAKVQSYSCEECNIKFKFESDLERHKKVHTGENIETNVPTYGQAKTYICKECNIKFKFESDLERHKKVHTGENIETNAPTYGQAKTCICKECNIKFKFESDLERHKKVHTGENIETNAPTSGQAKTYICKECNIKFKFESDLERHKKVHTGENIETNVSTYGQAKTYICKECNIKFKFESDLERHKRVHTGVNIETNDNTYGQAKTYTCKECNIKFRFESDLERHKIIHTGASESIETNDLIHTAENIDTNDHIHTSENIDTNAHIYTGASENIETNDHIHTSENIDTNDHTYAQEKNYTCKECNNEFKLKIDLEKHKRVHTAENIETNEHTHEQAKTYSCKECNNEFILESDLEKHKCVHTSENIETNEHSYGQAKTYSCKECNNEFKSESDLERHKRIHTAEKTYECEICETIFFAELDLLVHMETHIYK